MDSKAERYYPTYKAVRRDVLLIEFEEAQKIANGQTKVYGQVTNILLAVVTVLIPLFIGQDKYNIESNSLLYSIIIFLFGSLLLRYFVDLQRQITVNARKVVTLRTLLGLDYGPIHLTLPNWRVEGATNPFVIKYFNGWLRFESMPFWTLAISVNIIWWLATKELLPLLSQQGTWLKLVTSWHIGHIIITVAYLYIFRTNLNDRHETNWLNAVKILAWFLRLKLTDNFEYILYRAKLSYIELDRLKVNYENLKTILIIIEDHDYYKNIGFSPKALVRAILSHISFFRKRNKYIESGGSTITMQLARSLFIPPNQNKIVRKIIEILLSIWLTRQFTKEEILKLYITSVRYEKGVLGLSKAIKLFFGKIKSKTLTNEESFFLVERLSNVTSSVGWNRINHLKTRVTSKIDSELLRKLYENQISNGKLKISAKQ